MQRFSSRSRSIRAAGITFAAVLSALASIVSPLGNLRAEEIRQTFDVHKHSRGLGFAWDKLWVGGVGSQGEWIRAYDPATGLLVDSIPAPTPDCLGLEGIGDGLIYLSTRSDSIYLIRERSTTAIPTPEANFAGLAFDGANIWGASYFASQPTLYALDLRGRVIAAQPYSGRQSRDMTYHLGKLYIADQLTNNVRVVLPETARFNRAMASPGGGPRGLATDGSDLWLLDEGDQKSASRVYRIYVRPEGGIRFSALDHNFGSVVIDESRDWTIWVYNDGPRETRLLTFEARDGNDDIFIPHLWSFPNSIPAGDSVSLTFSFSPAYQDSVHIYFAFTYDLDRQENLINLRGKGVRNNRDILISNRNLIFGMTWYGQNQRNSNMRKLIIENNGGEPLTIRDLRFSDQSFNAGQLQFPMTLRTPGAYVFPIFFRPNRNGEIRGTVTVVSDDPDTPQINVTLIGQSALNSYRGGTPVWNWEAGDGGGAFPRARGLLPIDDITGDGLADLVVASNDFSISSFHAASTASNVPFWTTRTDANPWRSGRVSGQRAISEGEDWNRDGVRDIVVGLDGGALTINAFSGKDGRQLWMMDTHGFRGGGGVVIVAQATTDFNGDRSRDVYAACAASGEDHTTNAAFVVDGRTTRVLWLSPLQAPPLDLRQINDVTGDNVPDLIVGSLDGRIAGLDGREGSEIWSAEGPGDIVQMILMEDVNGDGSQDMLMVYYDHGLMMINGSNGTELWRVEHFPRSKSGLALDDINGNGAIDAVIGDENSFLRAIDGRDGVAVWDTTQNAGATPWSMDDIGDLDYDGIDDFVVGTSEGRLLALSGNGRDGLWSYSNVHAGNGFQISISGRDFDGNGEDDVVSVMESGMVYVFAGSYVGRNGVVGESALLPGAILLDPAYPNPFNSTVSLPFTLSGSRAVTLRVFNLLGREIDTRSLGTLAAGRHRVLWNGDGLAGWVAPSGFYLLRLETDDYSASQRLQLIR